MKLTGLQMKSSNLKKWCIAIVIASACVVFTLAAGCSTPGYEDFAASERTPLDVNEPAPYHGMLIPFDDYDYFLRLENYAEQNAILP